MMIRGLSVRADWKHMWGWNNDKRRWQLRQLIKQTRIQVEYLWLPAFVGLICRKLSDLADSQKQIITGMYPVVPVGLVMQATVATVTGSVSQCQWFEFGREFYKTEWIQLQSWLSLFGTCTSFSIDCICLFYEITNEIPWFRVISRIPFQVGNSANSASFPRSRKITGPRYTIFCLKHYGNVFSVTRQWPATSTFCIYSIVVIE